MGDVVTVSFGRDNDLSPPRHRPIVCILYEQKKSGREKLRVDDCTHRIESSANNSMQINNRSAHGVRMHAMLNFDEHIKKRAIVGSKEWMTAHAEWSEARTTACKSTIEARTVFACHARYN